MSEKFVPMPDGEKPIHKFSGCMCPADPIEHCNEMMPDNTFLLLSQGGGLPMNKSEPMMHPDK